jgi:LacI family transcriptional regulator
MAKIPHVALLIETSRSYGRGLLRGVNRYTTQHGPWSVYMELRSLESKAPPWLRGWRGDGILTRTGRQGMADVIRRTGVPAIELRSSRLRHGFPFVGVDNHAMGRTVAEHFLERGFRHFGVYELDTEVYFEERRDDFIRSLRQAGYPCSVFHAPGHREKPAQWEKHQGELGRWVSRLPKPVGIMACTDQLGFWLLDACKRAGVAVPDEAAVVSVENDESLCSMSTPPLSSVDINAERVGYVAAELLARMMAGRGKVPKQTLIPPRGIVTRQSSDVMAVTDEEVAHAVRFIRDRACAGITVGDVVRAVALSRSSLERRMRAALGRSPKAEILRVQLRTIEQLLVETDLSLVAIASRTGFAQPHYVNAVFKRHFGRTPGAFRAAFRA